RRRDLNVIIALGQYTWSNYGVYYMLSSPFESIHDRTMSRVADYHRPWKSETIIRYRAWHARMDLGWHTWFNDVRRWMPSSPLDQHTWWHEIVRSMKSSPFGSTSGRMMSRVTCHLCPWTAHTVGRLRRGMPSSHLDNIYGWRTSGEACHHGPCPEHTVKQRRAWQAIIAL
ncbi:hypothetical protein EJD97_021201, partial [Solanum chilense]